MSNRLYRSEKDRMIGGVCSGVAAHLNLDPVLVRLGFVLLTLFKGVGLLLYILLLFLMPLNPDEDVEES